MTDGNMSNSLKVSIALGQKPAIIQKGPFYLMKSEPIMMSEITGATNLMASKNLEHSFQKLAAKKMKDSLSSFLPGLPGMIDVSVSQQDNSSLRQLIEKPPVGGKELMLLNQLQLAGFRLHPGPLPEQYRTLLNQMPAKEKKKHKKKKHRGSETPAGEDKTEDERREKKKHKKKDHDSEGAGAKKKKKEKKKKRSHDKDP